MHENYAENRLRTSMNSAAGRFGCVLGIVLVSLVGAAGCAERTASPMRTDVLSMDASECVISPVPVAKISGDNVDIGLVRLSATHIYLENVDRVAVFNSRGRFLRWLGKRGSGPGEFRTIQDMVAMDSGRLGVFEAYPARLTVFDSVGAVLSTVPLPVATERGGVMMLDDGSFIVAGKVVNDASRFGTPVVHISSDGQVLRYIGEDETEKTGTIRGLVAPRLVTYHPKHGYVSIPRIRYEIEMWNPDGVGKKTLSVPAEWFTWPAPPPDPSNPHAVGAPSSLFQASGVDENGYVWLVARIAPEEWKQAVQNGRVVDPEAWTDYRIDVWDLERQELHCSARFHPYLPDFGFAGSRQLASYDEDASGEPSITVWRLDMKGR